MTGDPYCEICKSHFLCSHMFGMKDTLDPQPCYSYPISNQFLEDRIRFLEQEIIFLTEQNSYLRSFHASDCEVFQTGIKCSCHLLGAK